METTNVRRFRFIGPLLAVVAAVAVLIGISAVQTGSVAADGPYDRIEVSVGKDGQFFKVATIFFTCSSTSEVVPGAFKDHLKDVNPPPNINPDSEVWGATFSDKCIGAEGVVLLVTPVEPANTISIKDCAYINTGSGANEPCTVINLLPPGPGEAQLFAQAPKPVPTATATPTVTPVPPVGGIGVFPGSGDSSGSSSVAVSIGFAAITTAIALAGAAWYARRRWAR